MPGVQAIAAYDLFLDTVADHFFMAYEVIRQYKNKPGQALALFYSSPEYRTKLWKTNDPYEPRSAAFYIRHYDGPLLEPSIRASRMLSRVRTSPGADSLVFFDLAGSDVNMSTFQNYARDTGREFILLDLTRQTKPSHTLQGARHIENVEGDPSVAAKAIYGLLTA